MLIIIIITAIVKLFSPSSSSSSSSHSVNFSLPPLVLLILILLLPSLTFSSSAIKSPSSPIPRRALEHFTYSRQQACVLVFPFFYSVPILLAFVKQVCFRRFFGTDDYGSIVWRFLDGSTTSNRSFSPGTCDLTKSKYQIDVFRKKVLPLIGHSFALARTGHLSKNSFS